MSRMGAWLPMSSRSSRGRKFQIDSLPDGDRPLTAVAPSAPNQSSTSGVATDMQRAARSAPAAGRNRGPILLVLRGILPRSAHVLEIASGTGEHAVWFSTALPELTWQPTDLDPDALSSIAAWRDHTRPPNLLPPLVLDAAADTWPVAPVDAVVAINMVHIAPWNVTHGLIAGAARVLSPGGLLFLYGPFSEGGLHTASSNAKFDAALRARDPLWGIRDLDDICALASQHGFNAPERIAMPANNLSVVFPRR